MNAPSEVDEIFDEISYDKGASVIRMLHRYTGETVSIVDVRFAIVRSFM